MTLNISNVLQFVLHFFLLSYSCEEETLKPSSNSAQFSVEDLDLQKMLDFVRELSGPMIVMSVSGQDFSHVNGDQVRKALGEYFV